MNVDPRHLPGGLRRGSRRRRRRAMSRPSSGRFEDGAYFVVRGSVRELVACGGWSRRAKLYSGSGDAEGDDRLLEPATQPAHVRAMSPGPLDAARAWPADPRGLRGGGEGRGLPGADARGDAARPAAVRGVRVPRRPAGRTSSCPTACRSPASGWTGQSTSSTGSSLMAHFREPMSPGLRPVRLFDVTRQRRPTMSGFERADRRMAGEGECRSNLR